MAKDYDNTNRGALFKNADKQEETHADYQGSINVGGAEFWISARIKTSKAGAKYMSLSVKPKMPGTGKVPPKGKTDVDSDIPF